MHKTIMSWISFGNYHTVSEAWLFGKKVELGCEKSQVQIRLRPMCQQKTTTTPQMEKLKKTKIPAIKIAPTTFSQ